MWEDELEGFFEDATEAEKLHFLVSVHDLRTEVRNFYEIEKSDVDRSDTSVRMRC